MEHWAFTEDLKESSKFQRRIDSRELVNEDSVERVLGPAPLQVYRIN